VRINIESVFQQFDSQLSAALAKAALETIPGMTTKGALRLYSTFRRNAITALSHKKRPGDYRALCYWSIAVLAPPTVSACKSHQPSSSQ